VNFAADTAVEPLGDGVYGAVVHERWFVARGPNGGYIAAIIARALRGEIADDERALRSLTVHYLLPPVAGPLEVHVTVERAGRTATALSARLVQDGRTLALALAAAARAWPGGIEYANAPMPDVPPPEELPNLNEYRDSVPPFARNWEMRPAIGAAPFTGGDEARAGGWLRLDPPEPPDEALAIAMTDTWFPAPFSIVTAPLLAPTIDLTIHLRAPMPAADEFVFLLATSRVCRDGLFDEDVEIWSRDGTLVAQSRQLARAIEPDLRPS
jgi:acyl-CoA thioesterase